MQLAKQFSLLFDLHKMESNGALKENTSARESLEQGLDFRILKHYRTAREKGIRGLAILEDGACSNCHNVYAESYTVFGCGWFITTCAFCGTLLMGYESGTHTQQREEHKKNKDQQSES